MTAVGQLPAILQPWAAALAVLDADIAVALGPLVRQLDSAMSPHELVQSPTGELDGYDGIAQRGDPSRIMLSEWAISDALPEEFLRRLSSSELLYTAPAYREPVRRGRVAALLDVGPDTFGAPRLVQMTALIALHRQAVAHGSELAVGFLGDQPGTWHTGPIESVLHAWLQARRAHIPDRPEVNRWLADEPHAEDIWLLGGLALAYAVPGRRRCLFAGDPQWGPAGVTAIRTAVDGRTLTLTLPRSDLCVRALRGAGFTNRPPPVEPTITGLQFPQFRRAIPESSSGPTTAGRSVSYRSSRAGHRPCAGIGFPARWCSPASRPVAPSPWSDTPANCASR